MIDISTEDRGPQAEEQPREIWKRWMGELAISSEAEKKWRKEAEETIDVYKNKKKNIKFNILYSNVQTVSPALYLNTPRPDVRQRFADMDPAAKEASEVLERALIAGIDSYDFDYNAKGAVLDYQLTGRGVLWIDYEPTITEEPVETGIDPVTMQPTVEMMPKIAYQETKCVWVEWDKIRFGQASRWEKTPWVAKEHQFTKDEAIEKFGEAGAQLKCDIAYADESDKEKTEKDSIKRGIVFEIWSLSDRKIYFIAPSVEFPLQIKDDPYELEGFYPCPRPLLYVTDPDCQKPIVEYGLYKSLAEELNTVSKRISTLTKALRVRGIYDSTIDKMTELMKGDDADMIPSEGITAMMQAGGLEKAIWMFPIKDIASVLVQLYGNRDQIKQAIYEITGISDILRGSTDPNETAKAQGIKAQFGGLRMQERQKEVQRILRDAFRIQSEIIAKVFEPDVLGILIGKPVSPETIALLKSDLNRTIRVDVETDSTIAQDAEADKKNVTELLTSITQFLTAWGPILQSGLIPIEVPKALLMAATKRFKMGREVEDALNLIGQQQLPPQGLPPVAGAQAGLGMPPEAVPAQPVGPNAQIPMQ